MVFAQAYFVSQRQCKCPLFCAHTRDAEINAEAWATLNSDTSRAFEKPKSGRMADKAINHLGCEVMKRVSDSGDLNEVYDTERYLLCVACPRARDHLLVTTAGNTSEFLKDLKL